MSEVTNESRLHFVGGGKLDVIQPPDDVARLLWSPPGPGASGDGHDMGYAALQVKGGKSSVLVNPATVAYVEATPDAALMRFS